MIADPPKFLTRPIALKSWLLMALLIVYLAATLVIYFQAVVPSFADESTNETFSVDSTTYMYLGDAVREGRYDAYVLASLATFPNTAWTPVFIWWLLNSGLLVMLANYGIFAASILLLKKTFPMSLAVFIPLLLINPTTTTSLLCVNKEILDFFNLSLFLFARIRRNRWLLFAALGFALINRFEFCVVLLLFLAAESRLNPFKKWRFLTLSLLVVALNFLVPFLAGDMLAHRFEEAETANTIALLDSLQLHYLYVVAVIPKIAENLFGQLASPQVWGNPSSWLIINLFNNISYVIVIGIAAKKRLLGLSNNLIYLAAIGAVFVAQSLAVQPRYFQFVYILLCLRIAQVYAGEPEANTAPASQGDRDASWFGRPGEAFG